jgi:rare lipoprotein A
LFGIKPSRPIGVFKDFDLTQHSHGPIPPLAGQAVPASLPISSRNSLGWLRPAAVVMLGLLVANCASNPTKTASGNKYGVKASPKVIADGEPIPKGGGYDMVGKPYTVAGKLYVPREDKNYSAVGTASWYGPSFHGRMTANGEVFDRESISVAHPTMPLPSYVRVTNTLNGRSIIARVNDRGPYHDDRLVDVSEQVATSLNFKHLGIARVKVDYIGRAPMEGDDDKVLLATLRTDGRPAQLNRHAAPAQVASIAPFVPQAPVAEPAKPAAANAVKTATPTSVPAPASAAASKTAPQPPAKAVAAPAAAKTVASAAANSVTKTQANTAGKPAAVVVNKPQASKTVAGKPEPAKTAANKAVPAGKPTATATKKPAAKPQTAAATPQRKNDRG